MHRTCWAACRSGGHAWPLASAGAGAGSGSVHSQRPTATVHSQRTNRMRAQRAVPLPLLVASFLVAGHGVRGVWRLGVGCAQGLLCHWRIRGGGQAFCGCPVQSCWDTGEKKPGAGIWCGRQADTSEPSNPRGVRRAAGTTNHCQCRCPKRPHLRAATTTRVRRVPWLPSAEGTPGRRCEWRRVRRRRTRTGWMRCCPSEVGIRWPQRGHPVWEGPEGVRRPSAGLPLTDGGGEARARGASSADCTVVVMGTRVTARAAQCGTGSHAVGLRRVAAGRVGDSTPMARRQEGGEGQRILWRLPDAQLNSGSSAMSTKAATPDCSGEGAMTSSYDTLHVGIRGVHRAVSMKCLIQVPIGNVRFENARGSRAFSDWSQVPISNVPYTNARGSRACSYWSGGWSHCA